MFGIRGRLSESRKRRAKIEGRFDTADDKLRHSADRAVRAGINAESAVERAANQLLSDHDRLLSGGR